MHYHYKLSIYCMKRNIVSIDHPLALFSPTANGQASGTGREDSHTESPATAGKQIWQTCK